MPSAYRPREIPQVIEKHNADGKRPEIELWPESHLELLLAPLPALVTE
jgi:hypothetical protein